MHTSSLLVDISRNEEDYMNELIHRLMTSNLLEVFNERDPQRRREAIARTYQPDVRWTDNDGVCVGHADLDAKAGKLQSTLGPLQFVTAGPVHQTTGFGFLAWHLVTDDGSPQVSGFDV